MSDGINMKELKQAVTELNEAGVLDKKIKIVGVGKDDLAAAFEEAVNGLDDEKAEKLTAFTIDFFNNNFGEDENTEEGGVEASDEEETDGEESEGEEEPEEESEPEEEEKPKKAAKKEKAKKAPKEKKEKKSKEPVEKSRYGHTVGSQAALIDDAIFEGGTMQEMMEATGLSKARIKSHIYHLEKKKGIVIKTTGEGDKTVFKAKK